MVALKHLFVFPSVKKIHHLTQAFNRVHHLEGNFKCKGPSLYVYEITGQDMFGAWHVGEDDRRCDVLPRTKHHQNKLLQTQKTNSQ